MKQLKIIVLFLCITNLVNAQGNNTERLPNNFEDLNNYAPLIYNLNEQNKYQPLHIEIGKTKAFTVIGRFKGEKLDNSTFELSGIEFAFYEASNSQQIIVQKAWVTSRNKKNIEISIELKDLSDCNSSKCNDLEANKEDGNPDFNLKTNKLIITKGANLDFHISNLDDIYKKRQDGPAPKDLYPRGRHCNGFTIF